MPNAVIATVTPSTIRRAMAVGMLAVLGGLLLYVAFTKPPERLVWQVVMLAVGVGCLMLGQRVWQATSVSIELTEDALRDSSGRVLCTMAQVDAIERGALAFKPSNGFVVRLKEPGARAWAPGLWWRFGRRLGVGGVTSVHEGKAMADQLSMRLAERRTR
jgi:hypothetical protein